MREIHLKSLKKFTPHDVKEMRDMVRKGIGRDIIARVFNCNPTTVTHWCSDLEEYDRQNIEKID
jgi:DNA invertase Pin-like site-specific DNA recombinase